MCHRMSRNMFDAATTCMWTLPVTLGRCTRPRAPSSTAAPRAAVPVLNAGAGPVGIPACLAAKRRDARTRGHMRRCGSRSLGSAQASLRTRYASARADIVRPHDLQRPRAAGPQGPAQPQPPACARGSFRVSRGGVRGPGADNSPYSSAF
ncbi:FADR057Wp [Eremothecium gossypii FDAG1]|nr:FADR057Wp [Eremothecium gossypii FDAG1]